MSLLDQRIAQLERTSLPEPTAVPPAESQATGAPVAPATVVQSSENAAIPSTGKPSKNKIQQALKNAGFYQGPVDGKLGAQTREAIKAFQRANGLRADGVVGRGTWEKLRPYLNVVVGAGKSTETSPVEVLK